jgi:hypothetical protein
VRQEQRTKLIYMADESTILSSSGGDSGARTRSLRLAKPALSQLSYIPNLFNEEQCRGRRNGGPEWTRTTHLTLIRRAL